jgi:hypothetical protein
VSLSAELGRAAEAARAFAERGEDVLAIIAAEPEPGSRVYLCAFESGWVGLDAAGRPVEERELVRRAASIAALCELAEETSGGGDLGSLRAELRRLALTENPEGIEEAEEAALALEQIVGAPPRVATPAYLDAVGTATRRLEQALGDAGASPFAQAMQSALGAADELTEEIERSYKLELR